MKTLLILSLFVLIGCNSRYHVGDCFFSQHEGTQAKIIQVLKYGMEYSSFMDLKKEKSPSLSGNWYSTFEGFSITYNERMDCRPYMEEK